ncbi:NAD(P)/FAD-dependent oxidoreductase [Rheinheimera marina]|uniref:NAD(P)/FAD-dependent oxidoreductase n=1 Tax=Rheinheimera marina TaxID=1774958 RepID=A0ABV9JHV9_9GAMM
MLDCLVIGGGFAGLSAAMQLARGQRSVVVLDAGEPRNRFSSQSHGFFTLDGVSPAEILKRAWAPLLAYPTVSRAALGRAVQATKTADGFVVASTDGHSWHSKSLVLATGVTDTLPAIPGLAERWGKTAIHCPYCHGYELRNQPTVVIASSPHSVHQAAILPDWGPTTYCTQGQFEPDAEQLEMLQRRGVRVERSPVVAVEGEGQQIDAVRLADGRRLAAAAVYLAPKTSFGHQLAEQLGLAVQPGMTGPVVVVDEMKQSSVPGVFVAGDNSSPMHNATLASAAGVLAGGAAHRYLMLQYQTVEHR